jgi:hypothetical protein
VNYSHRCPNGNRQMRRVLNQAANAAVKAKGTIFNVVYRRLVPRFGHAQAFGAITHRLCRLIWKILHQQIRYEERGPAVSTLGQESTRAQEDPRAAKPRVPRRAAHSSGRQSSLSSRRLFSTLAHPRGCLDRPVFADLQTGGGCCSPSHVSLPTPAANLGRNASVIPAEDFCYINIHTRRRRRPFLP